MTTAADVIRVAKSQVGTKEYPYGSNRQKYGEWYGLNGAPWCAMFVSWVMHHAGVNLDISTSKGYAYCPSGVSWFQSRRLWRSSRLSKSGDIIFFNFNGGSIAEHTGIVLSNNPLSGYITTVEGNTGVSSAANGGEVMIQTRSRSVVLGTGNMQGFYTNPRNKPISKPAAKKLNRRPKWMNDDGKYGHPTLKRGNTGKAVEHLQELLLKHGRNIVVDGDFGPSTEEALLAFKKYHKINDAPQCGGHTWPELHR